MTQTKWRLHGVRVVHANELDTNTAQTPGMNRAAAITHARAGAEKLWAGTVVIHPKAKTGAHHHGAGRERDLRRQRPRAHELGRPARVHGRGGARRFHLRAAVRAAPGDQRERRRAAVVRAVPQRTGARRRQSRPAERRAQSRRSALGRQHPSRSPRTASRAASLPARRSALRSRRRFALPLLGIQPRDVLRAVRVPGLDREQDRLLGARLVVRRHQARDQRRVVLDHARASP